jgi:hypothetical protein
MSNVDNIDNVTIIVVELKKEFRAALPPLYFHYLLRFSFSGNPHSPLCIHYQLHVLFQPLEIALQLGNPFPWATLLHLRAVLAFITFEDKNKIFMSFHGVELYTKCSVLSSVRNERNSGRSTF